MYDLRDNDMIEQNKMAEKNTTNEEREKEICQNCGIFFSPYDDYVTLCSKCRFELLGI